VTARGDWRVYVITDAPAARGRSHLEVGEANAVVLGLRIEVHFDLIVTSPCVLPEVVDHPARLCGEPDRRASLNHLGGEEVEKIEVVLLDVLLPDAGHDDDLMEEAEALVVGLGVREFDDLHFPTYPELSEKRSTEGRCVDG
jgi:hypothetical protein